MAEYMQTADARPLQRVAMFLWLQAHSLCVDPEQAK
jgi:hypothetical protein